MMTPTQKRAANASLSDKVRGAAGALDEFFNISGDGPRTGFILIMFDADNINVSEIHYKSSGVSRDEAITLYKEMIARLEGTLHEGGHA